MLPLSFLLLLFSSATTIATATHNRRILHQPFFPQDSFPPSQPPNPSPPAPTTPKYPFSSTSAPNNTPFFPFYPSPPPPPSPASFASFPANISSLVLPKSSKSKPASSKLIAAAIAAVVAAIIVVSLAIFLHLRRRRNRDSTDTKTHRSENSTRFNYSNATNTNNGGIPKLQRPSQTSSEFLYLGTLVNSHGAIDNSNSAHQIVRNSTADSSPAYSRKLDSPELRPLPPLSGQQNFRRNYGNAKVGSVGDEDGEEFYSPRGSLGGRESSIGNGSASRRAFATVEVENFGRSSSASYSSSSSASGSPVRSVSLSISPPVSLSPKASRPKSPELVALQTAPPTRPRSPPPPPPVSLFNAPFREHRLSPSPSPSLSPSLSRSPSPSPSPPSSSSPERVYSRSRDTSPRISNVSDQNLESPVLIRSPAQQNVPVSIPSPPPPPPPPPPQPQPPTLLIPPPPPPPPPIKHWESPRTPSPAPRKVVSEPPVMAAPSRPLSLESPTLISPMQLPSNSETVVKNEETVEAKGHSNENPEKNETPKPKLKPLHWDKVRASSDREMVWDQLKSSSFKLDEEMIETLFVVNNPTPAPKETTRRPILPSSSQENRVLDPKKSQNIAILLRALNVTVEEVCEALIEGNADNLGTELLESLLRMAPTKEEERKLKEHKDDSPVKLGPAEKFLKALLDIPFAFKRVDAMLYISNFDSEVEYLKRSFDTLEAACEELRNSRMFLKLLEAVLKTGNRMNVGTNRGDAHAFKLDTLLKLVDVKGADGKTTLLHFVVQEIIRSEGARLSSANQNQSSTINDDVKCRKLGLQVVSGLSSDLANVKKAAAMDSEVLNSDVVKLSKGIENIAEIVRSIEAAGSEESSCQKFSESMSAFRKRAEEEIIRIQAQESVALTLVKEITEYFHGNSAKEEAHPFRIFMVVRDFLTILDRVCKEVGMINERTMVSSAHKFPVPVNPNLQPISNGFPARQQYSSSDDEGSSP